MTFITTILVMASLSMDNFAVSLASGCNPSFTMKDAAKCGVVFAFAHFVMFSSGWLCAGVADRYIESYDHWIAFGLLIFIGLKMIKEAITSKDGESCNMLGGRIILISIATSVDALAMGISLRFAQVNYMVPLVSMCLFVFVTTLAGVKLGGKLGAKFGSKAEIFGGLVLMAIGIKVLLDGTL